MRYAVTFFFIAGVFLLLSPAQWYPDWFFPTLTGIGAFIYAFLLLWTEFLFPLRADLPPEAHERRFRSRRRLQNYLALGFVLGFSGTLGLYELDFPFDKVNHLLLSFLATVAISRFLYRWWELPLVRSIILTVFAVLFLSTLWEIIEYTSDVFLGTSAFGLRGKEIYWDTFFDMTMNVGGVLVGIFAVLMRKKPWPY